MGSRTRFLAYPSLFRLSIAFTPVADILTGYYGIRVDGPPHETFDPRILLACAASVAAFCFGTSLNDYLDRFKDAALAPERPLPSGRISPSGALWSVWVMAGLSLGLAAVAGPTTLAAEAIVLLLAAVYNLGSRRIAWLGVVNLGVLRAADLFVGVSLIHGSEGSESWWAFTGRGVPPAWIPLLYGLYGIALSFIALGERGQQKIGLRLPAAGLALLSLVPVVLVSHRDFLIPALILWAVLVLPIYRFFDKGAAQAERLVGHLVSGFFLLGALFLLGKDHPLACTLLWILYFFSRGLSRIYPPA